MISPPRVNVGRTSDSGERTDGTARTDITVRRRGTGVAEKSYHSDMEEVRGATVGRASLAGRRSLAGSEVRRTGSLTRRGVNGN